MNYGGLRGNSLSGHNQFDADYNYRITCKPNYYLYTIRKVVYLMQFQNLCQD